MKTVSMKRAKRLMRVALAVGCCLSTGCGRNRNGPTDSSSAKGSDGMLSEDSNQWSKEAYERAFAHADKEGPPKWSLPNFVAGPGMPRPDAVNFYRIDKHYLAYLLCEYDVRETHYDQGNEPEWFKAALLQIRATGRDKFPPFVKWVAVIICNRAEGVAGHPIAESSKAGATFDASEIFDPTLDISQLVAQADVDRHPSKYNPQGQETWDVERWLIVERHAAATATATNSNDRTNAPEPHR